MENFEMSLPYNLEAEQALLGSVLYQPSCLSTLQLTGFSSEYFYRNEHRAIYNAFIKLDSEGKQIDPLLVLNELKADNVFDDAAGRTYLAELAAVTLSVANVESYAKIIRDKYYLRSLINASREISDEASSSNADAMQILESAESKIYNIRQKNGVDSALLADVISDEVYPRLSALNSDNEEERNQYKGFTTGWSDLDDVLTGLHRADLVIIGARPAMGKTSLALNLARNAAVLANKKVVVFSLEMTKPQLAQRIIATEARITGNKMRTGDLNSGDWERLALAAQALHNAKIYLDDTSGITVNEIKAKVRRMKDVDLVIIDYLQLMESSVRSDNRVQQISEITRSLKLMAKDLNIPVVTLAQLSRGTEGHGQKSHRPQLADLRDSGTIEQDADIVILLYREDYYQTPDDEIDTDKQIDTIELNVAKNRHGPTKAIELAWNSEFTLFSTIERKLDFDL